ncbi:MAG: response regulator transcription factor [Alistipes sp.]|nr:response regulator transcription factor [Alistipes sp.]
MAKKIALLLVEDERILAEILCDTLCGRDFEVTLAYDGEEGYARAQERSFDVIVSDIMMPRLDGFSMVKRLRKEGCTSPVLFLTARSSTDDVVKGFEVGGNDFLRKPFAIDELIVRVRALAGRLGQQDDHEAIYHLGRYTFDVGHNLLRCGEEEITLAARETAVLAWLCRHAGQVVEASALLRELWGDDNFFNLRSLNVYISRLRRHLAAEPSLEIVSIRGVGYKLQVRA